MNINQIVTYLENHIELIAWLGGASLVLFLLTLALLPLAVAAIPTDYFKKPTRRSHPWRVSHPTLNTASIILRNVFGFICIVIGLLLLVLPGQGLITILTGIILLDVPGKYTFERWLVQKPAVHRTINWLREKMHRPPLAVPNDLGQTNG